MFTLSYDFFLYSLCVLLSSLRSSSLSVSLKTCLHGHDDHSTVDCNTEDAEKILISSSESDFPSSQRESVGDEGDNTASPVAARMNYVLIFSGINAISESWCL